VVSSGGEVNVSSDGVDSVFEVKKDETYRIIG
jgi:hypothetical protein